MYKFIIKFLTLFILLSFINQLLAKPLVVILDWFANPDHAPLFVAQEQGFFKQQGVEVQFITPADPADPPKLVAAGKADIAITYQPQYLLQIHAGLPLVKIATLIATPLNCVIVPASSSIKSIADLKGKTIGYSSGGFDNVMLQAMLKNNGLSLQDVKLINVHYNLTQALLSGKVDAITGTMRNFEPIEMTLAGKPGRVFYPEENGVPLYDELILITNKNELHDPRIQKFLTALQNGVVYLINHPQASWQLFVKQHPELDNQLNEQSWYATLPRFALRPTAEDPQRYATFTQFLKEQGMM